MEGALSQSETARETVVLVESAEEPCLMGSLQPTRTTTATSESTNSLELRKNPPGISWLEQEGSGAAELLVIAAHPC